MSQTTVTPTLRYSRRKPRTMDKCQWCASTGCRYQRVATYHYTALGRDFFKVCGHCRKTFEKTYQGALS